MSSDQSPLERARAFEREQARTICDADRPLFHFTPPVGWTNDPNGFCFYKGQYHLFHQYHPFSRDWGPMHWGHAVSDDLLHWRHLPCALAPDTAADAGGCFSGSALPLPDGRLLLCYTGVQAKGDRPRGVQAQCVAIGDGTDFVKSPMNPVAHPGQLPAGCSFFDFRDPKIWREKDGSFRMAVANLRADRQGAILLLESRDALAWQYRGEIDASRGEYGKMWECPDLFPLEGKQVLLVSPKGMTAREEFHPGHGTLAILGQMEDGDGRFIRESLQPVDLGLDFYAPQTALAPDGRRLMIGWMDCWETCGEAPRRHPWYGQMSVPRELTIENGRLMQRPVREIETLWRDTVLHEHVTVQEETALPGVRGRLLDLTVKLCPEGFACRRFALKAARDGAHHILIRCDLDRGELLFDRSRGGSCRDIAHARRVKAALRDGVLTLRLLLDKESMELFINDGERVVTALIPAPLTADGIAFSADAPLRLWVEAHHLG